MIDEKLEFFCIMDETLHYGWKWKFWDYTINAKRQIMESWEIEKPHSSIMQPSKISKAMQGPTCSFWRNVTRFFKENMANFSIILGEFSSIYLFPLTK